MGQKIRTILIVQDTIHVLKWDLLQHPPYSIDLAPSFYHLFPSMAHYLAELYLVCFEEVRNWFRFNDTSFYRRSIHVLPERVKKSVASKGLYYD